MLEGGSALSQRCSQSQQYEIDCWPCRLRTLYHLRRLTHSCQMPDCRAAHAKKTKTPRRRISVPDHDRTLLMTRNNPASRKVHVIAVVDSALDSAKVQRDRNYVIPTSLRYQRGKKGKQTKRGFQRAIDQLSEPLLGFENSPVPVSRRARPEKWLVCDPLSQDASDFSHGPARVGTRCFAGLVNAKDAKEVVCMYSMWQSRGSSGRLRE